MRVLRPWQLAFGLLLSVTACGSSYQAPAGPAAVAPPEPSDQQCSRDAECVLVQDCCGCTRGGLQQAVHRDSVERLTASAGDACSAVQCADGPSEHRSCD